MATPGTSDTSISPNKKRPNTDQQIDYSQLDPTTSASSSTYNPIWDTTTYAYAQYNYQPQYQQYYQPYNYNNAFQFNANEYSIAYVNQAKKADPQHAAKKQKVVKDNLDGINVDELFNGDKVSDELYDKMEPFMEIKLPDSAFQRVDAGDRGVILEKGSLLLSDCDVVIHCCNCFHKMQAGIANKVKKEYTGAFQMDKRTPKGDLKKMGHYSAALVDGIITFVNLYAQYTYGSDDRKVNYAAMRLGLKRFVERLKKIEGAVPKIGTY